MSTAGVPARSAHALGERDVNVPAVQHVDASDQHLPKKNTTGASPDELPPAPGSSPSKAAALKRRQQAQAAAGAPPSAASMSTTSQLAAAPTVTFSEDAFAGLREEPQQRSTSVKLVLYGSYTHTLILGRSKPSGKPHVSAAASTPAGDTNPSVSQNDALRADIEALHRHSPNTKAGLPSNASGQAASPSASPKYMRVCLPNKARHVSRVHALLHYSPFPSASHSTPSSRISPSKIPQAMLGSFILRIVGQNGLYVDGERLRADTIVTLVPGRTRLGFFSDVEALFDVQTDAMPAHIRSRALELQSRLLPRAVNNASTGSPIKKKNKTATTSSSLLALVQAAEQTRGAVASSGRRARSPSREHRKGKQIASQSVPGRDVTGPTPPPTSSPLRETQGYSQRAVSQSLRALSTADADMMSPPPSSSPIIGHVDIDPMTGLRKRKLREVVQPSEDESDFGSDGSNSSFGGDRADNGGQPPSSPAAAANHRRTAGKVVKGRAATPNESEDDQASEEDSDSALSSASSLSDVESLSPVRPLPVRRPVGSAPAAKKTVTIDTAADAAKKMPPPALPVRSSVRQSLSAAANPTPRSSAPPPVNADPMAVARGSYLQSAARRAVAALKASHDLEAYLVHVIVVDHRTASMAASEAVQRVLHKHPGLMNGTLGDKDNASERMPDDDSVVERVGGKKKLRCFSFQHALANAPLFNGRKLTITAAQWQSALTKAWREQLELVLRYFSAAPEDSSAGPESGEPRGPFGAIHRPGKDAAGNPLEPWYYYKPEADPDRGRAMAMATYVKPLRGALKNSKPIYWKKSAYGHNESDIGPADDEGDATTCAGGTSFLSRTVANEVWGSNVDWAMDGANPTSSSTSSSAGGRNARAAGAPALETQFNGLSESLVASSHFGYSTTPALSASFSSSSSSAMANTAALTSISAISGIASKLLARSAADATAAAAGGGSEVPEGVTQRLVDRVWTETQEEEERETTWDKFGDMDWKE